MGKGEGFHKRSKMDGAGTCVDLQHGALGKGRFLFRPQVFWQELLPEHVASNQLEFSIGMGDDKRNLARLCSEHCGVKALLPPDAPQLIEAAVCVEEGRGDEAEVSGMLRAASSWGDCQKVRRLLASCFVTPDVCSRALCETAARGHLEVVNELLRVKAPATAEDGISRKSALHFACEQGHEGIAKTLLSANASLLALDGTGSTACDLAREQDLGMMAKRLEQWT